MGTWNQVFRYGEKLIQWESCGNGYQFYELHRMGDWFYDYANYFGRGYLAFYLGESSEHPDLHKEVEGIKALIRQRAAIKNRYGYKPRSVRDWWLPEKGG